MEERMLSQADDDILAVCYRHLQERPIEPGHPFYVEIWEHSDHDPIQRLRKHILWTEAESLQLFSGFNGSGKTTQLRRLQRELEARGYLVVYADAENYLNLREPVEIQELLITIAGAFSDNLDPSPLIDSYWDRLVNYLEKTEVTFSEATLKTPAISFKAELKSSPTFRQRIRKTIESRLPEFRRQVHAFVEEAVKTVTAKTPERRIVFLFDSFEKLRGTNRFMRLLDSHMVLLYKNETSWYDTLPLIRDEVARILTSNPEPVPE